MTTKVPHEAGADRKVGRAVDVRSVAGLPANRKPHVWCVRARAAVAIAGLVLPVCADKNSFDWPGGFGVPLDVQGPQYSIDQLHDEIASIYGNQLATEIAAEVGPGGSIGFKELTFDAPEGQSDIDTIALNTRDSQTGGERMSEFEAAMTVVHEYQHVQHIRNGPGGDGHDPVTSDPLCGSCAHALMHYEQMILVTSYGCDVTTCTLLRLTRSCAEYLMHGDSPCLNSSCPSLFGSASGAASIAVTALEACCE